MRTNIDIDDGLMAAAQEATGLPTKRAVVEEGLRALVRLRDQQGIRALRGRIGFVEATPEGDEQAVPDRPADGRAAVSGPARASVKSPPAAGRARARPAERRGKGAAEGQPGGGDSRRR